MLTETSTLLRTATVIDAVADAPVLRLEGGGETVARLALGWPYTPTTGDSVLAIGQDEQWFVIGVLQARGPMRFTAPGDLELSAPHGAIRLVSSKSVTTQAPDVNIEATNRLKIIARTVTERFNSAYRWVRNLFQIRANRVRTVADSTMQFKAERIVQRSEKDLKLEGQRIRLN